MKEKFLPIGTVVLLKKATKKLMITGYLPISRDNDRKIYDYSACLFPEGILASDQTAVFNHEQIEKIIQEGYSNDETTRFVEKLHEVESKGRMNQAMSDPRRRENNPRRPERPERPRIEDKPKIEEKPRIEEQDLPEQLDLPAIATEPKKAAKASPVAVDEIKPFSE